MLSKTVHLRPLKSSNYIRVKTPEKAARIHERNALNELNHEYKPILKTSYDTGIFKFQKARIVNASQPEDFKQPKPKPNEYESTHYSDYRIYKKKKYNEELKSITTVPMGKLVSRDEYEGIRSSSVGFALTPAAERGEEADKRNVYRRNLFVSKPFQEINKDFKFQPLVRKAQTGSEDTPYWFQGTAKYYTPENFETNKKTRSNTSTLPKADIFGKVNVEYPKPELEFQSIPPSKGQRYELNRMVVVEKKTAAELNTKLPKMKLKWDENPEKQSYDLARLTWKIGNNDNPFIKTVQAKANFNPMVAYKKIGEGVDTTRLKKEKPLDLKIGHPNDLYSYTKKGRDDGFLLNRKEITGENYQRSTFFV